MMTLIKKTVTLILFLSSIATVIYFVNDIKGFVLWWPSGWIVLLLVYVIFATPSFKIRYLKYRYGKGSGYKIVRFEGRKVFLLKDNKLIWIKNPETLYELGYDFDDVKQISHRGKKDYKEMSPISIDVFN